MNKAIGKWCYLAAALLCLAPCALTQTETLQISDPPSNNIVDNIYVGSYSATNTQTGANVQIVCDDFKDNSDYNSATYTVNTFNTLGNTLWGSQYTQQYEEAAYLTIQMLGKTGQEQGFYSYAIWAVFDSTDVAAWLTKSGDGSACNNVFGGGSWSSGKCTAGTGGLLKVASSQNFTPGEFSNFVILTPQGCKNGPGTCNEQEFLMLMPEGGSAALYLLLAGVSCFGAMFFRQRRQAPGARLGVV